MSIENGRSKLSHSSGVLCVVNDIPLRWSGSTQSTRCYKHVAPPEQRDQSMRFGYDVALHLCLLRRLHNNSLMEPTSTLTIFIIELTLIY